MLRTDNNLSGLTDHICDHGIWRTALIIQEKPWQMCAHGLQHIPPGIPLQ